MKLLSKIRLGIRKWAISKILSMTDSQAHNPYGIEIENTNDHEAKAVLFGHNIFANKKNYGSDNGVIVKNNYGYGEYACDYSHIIHELQLRTRIRLWRYHSNSNLAKWDHHITIVRRSATGLTYTTPVVLGSHWSPHQFQQNILDIIHPVTLDGNVYFELRLKPKQKIWLTLFPETRQVGPISSPDISIQADIKL